jgi:putative FmdB family regulatory protein
MPTYEYRCTRCNEVFEVYQSFHDEPLKRHRGCGGKVNKVFGSVGIVLKGPGFYRTDSRSGGGNGTRTRSGEAGGAASSGTGSATSAGSSSPGSGASKTPGADSG